MKCTLGCKKSKGKQPGCPSGDAQKLSCSAARKGSRLLTVQIPQEERCILRLVALHEPVKATAGNAGAGNEACMLINSTILVSPKPLVTNSTDSSRVLGDGAGNH